MTWLYVRIGLAAALLAAIIGGWLYVSGLHAEIDQRGVRISELTAERAEAIRIAQANADAAEQIRADAARRVAAVTETLTAERRLRAQFVEIREEIRHVPEPVQSCAVDPALRRAVERLRLPAATDDHAGGGSAPGSSSGAAGLRSAADAAGG